MKLFHNATFIPMTGENDRFEALVSDNAGRITYTGTFADAQAFAPDADSIDLAGATVLPGFIDAHSHFTMTAQTLSYIQLRQARSIPELLEELRVGIEERRIGPDGVAIGMGYDHNVLAELRHPLANELDQVSTEIPIVITHVSGHLGSANTRAYELAGISPTAPDPVGGHWVRDAEGRIAGPWEEPSAIAQIQATVMRPRFVIDYDALCADMQDQYLRYGITTCQDGASGGDAFDALVRWSKELGALKLDVVAYPVSVMGMSAGDTCAQNPDLDGFDYRGRVRIGGHKMILDGSPQGRTAWMSAPYLTVSLDDDPTYCGFPAMDDDASYAICRQAIDSGHQLLAHCNGDAASDQLLRCYRRALEDSPNPAKYGLRPVMVHCQTARREQYAQMRELGMIPSIFSSHVWYWADVHLKNFGQKRGSQVSACAWAVEAGLPFTLHNDTPIVPNDMMLSVWCAAVRRTKAGVELDQSLRVSVYEALRGITANAAYQYCEEARKGTLEVGKLADMAVLDRNPLACDPFDVRDIKILRTIKEGETVWES